MNDLPEQLRAATDDAPPSRIDLDSFIAREQRRTRLLRWSGASAGAAVLVAALLAVPALYAGGTGLTSGLGGAACPTPSPNPTEVPSDGATLPAAPSAQECAATVARLSAALRDVLAVTAPDRATGPFAGIAFVYQPRYAQYEADVHLSGPGGRGLLHVVVSELTEDPPSAVQVCPEGSVGRGCSYEVHATGAVVFVTDYADTRQVEAHRADGTRVMVAVGVPGVAGETRPPGAVPPLTMAQLVDIAEAPGLSLFPGRSPSARPTRDAAVEDLVGLFTLLLRQKFPDQEFASSPVQGSAETGYRTSVTVADEGSVSVEVTPACSGPTCPAPPPCPGPGDTSCTVRGDGSRVTVRDDATTRTVRVYTAATGTVTLRVTGPLVSRLTVDHLVTLAARLRP
ncbi:Rossmann-fold NAD(P)-binding domain-containing protein [Catellatospora paridis]|uniref:hypothetical protein n=1 Tax=Catellatospora paridis TaxID=1617086 RepID=UPI0012D3D51C|nr:hypothetical protein [Catellatospora paridis]